MELVCCSLSNLVDLCDIENLDTKKGKLCKDVTCSGCHGFRHGVKAQLSYIVCHSKETSQNTKYARSLYEYTYYTLPLSPSLFHNVGSTRVVGLQLLENQR